MQERTSSIQASDVAATRSRIRSPAFAGLILLAAGLLLFAQGLLVGASLYWSPRATATRDILTEDYQALDTEGLDGMVVEAEPYSDGGVASAVASVPQTWAGLGLAIAGGLVFLADGPRGRRGPDD